MPVTCRSSTSLWDQSRLDAHGSALRLSAASRPAFRAGYPRYTPEPDGLELHKARHRPTTMADMDLIEALQVMHDRAFVPGLSDIDVADAVQTDVNALVADGAANGTAIHAKPVTPAAGVDGGFLARPIEAMLRLARATRPLISDDVYDWYRHWGWLRYLGIFDHHPDGTLGLSAAGLGVRANQRRVMSEDLGVGFG